VTRLSDDCFAGDDRPMRLDEALAILLPRLPVLAGVEHAPLAQSLDRILAADVTAEIDVPAADNSAVDGYAVYFDDLDPCNETRLPVGGRAAAGHPLDRPARRGEAIRIFTGAPMPAGENDKEGAPDTVLMQEDCVEQNGVVTIGPGIARGANRRRAGEDLAKGTVALAAGTRLRPQDIGLAASLGATDLAVRTKLRVALFSTGDEIAEPGRSLEPGRIYDSNRYTLAALLTQLGLVVSDLGILPDRREAVTAALVDAAGDHDAIVTSGGVSVGDEDHVKAAVAAHGRIHLWRLAIKPGRPVALGQIRSGDASRPVFGLQSGCGRRHLPAADAADAAQIDGSQPCGTAYVPRTRRFRASQEAGAAGMGAGAAGGRWQRRVDGAEVRASRCWHPALAGRRGRAC